MRVGALFLVITGCAAVSVGGEHDLSYPDAVNAWTARAKLYDPIEEKASFCATIESAVFREQRLREEGRLYGWSPDKLQGALTKEAQAPDGETSFVVGAYTDRPRDNNLGDTHGIWQIALETPGGELAPVRVEALGRPDINLRKLYPYLDLYAKAYRVHFAKVAEGPVTLRISSGYGIAELKFERL